MSADIIQATQENLFEIRISGKLTEEDYEEFLPEIEALIEKQGKIRVLVELRDFEGWDAAALWEDIKFDAKHFNDIDRVAMVGEKAWHKGMAWFCKPFTTGKVRYFEPHEIGEARAWLTAP